uniref:mRNA n=1 Tax=Oulactis sp. TaxID=2093647 RepID=A0A4U8YVD0_OULSP|nr:mRNA [Oulactis sp. MM-2018]
MMLKCVLMCVFIPLLQVTSAIPDCDSSYSDNSGCPHWLQYCDNSLYEAFMNANCLAACGKCQAAPTSPPPYTTPEKISFDVSECLTANNLNRSSHQATDLQWDATLASASADWALTLAQQNSMQHSSGPYGENLYYSSTSNIGTVASCKDAVEAWYSEIAYYDYNNPGFASNTGHFTQVVWKATTHVGVGIAAVTSGGFTSTYVVARYTPAGNLQGAFAANVLPPSRK